MLEPIKVGLCLSYDWEMLATSLPIFYEQSEKIILSVDSQGRTWSGSSYELDMDGLKALVSRLDPLGKVQIYQDEFYVQGLSPMENETRQRTAMARELGPDGWCLQIDVDEHFYDFPRFVSILRSIPEHEQVDVCLPFLQLFKWTPSGFLGIKPASHFVLEWMQVAARNPTYVYGRRGGRFTRRVPIPLVHQSWARSPKDVRQKAYGWGHSYDRDWESFLALWMAIDAENYPMIANFHPLAPERWSRLSLLNATTVTEVLADQSLDKFLPIDPLQLWIDNSIWCSRFKKALRLFRDAIRKLSLGPAETGVIG